MAETLLASAMKEIAEAHKALDEYGYPGRFDMTLPQRIRGLHETPGMSVQDIAEAVAKMSFAVLDEETT